ncbi:MAG TPA: leucyl/phenylalanyl-tRNA--protein transferase [Isosphaeraceae bacterium]|jgi:leucyl/phenylalanyl-tRNA--protein transferase|nr:leucyl/phenylalanyl-tRNA--protein transferase [Isosphaeraceae bacterium]
MPIYQLDDRHVFPPPGHAEPSGLLAVGGDLEPARLLRAYAMGIFPWFEEGEPILWWSPDPRLILEPAALHVSRSLHRTLRRGRFTTRLDTAFPAVIHACATTPRRGQCGTWITQQMEMAYNRLYELGFAHCAEAWAGDELVGGIYGIALGGCFFGESMFSTRDDASKVAMVVLAGALQARGIGLIDCQVTSSHLLSLGAREVARREFLRRLDEALRLPTARGRWSAG